MRGTMGTIYIFGEWELDARLSDLRCAGKPLKLEPEAFDVLLYLIQHRDRVVSSEEIIEHVWPGQLLEKATLDRSVAEARRAIGDDGRDQWCIKSLQDRGYRFVAPVEERVDTLPEEEARLARLPSFPRAGYLWDPARIAPSPNPPPRQQGEPLRRLPLPPPQTTPQDRHRACPRCRQKNNVTARFCGECGARLVAVCPACGHEEPLRSQHCSACGAPLTQASSETSTVSSAQGGSGAIPSAEWRAPEAERRHLTVLFCDVINATALSVGLDPEVYRDLIAAYHAVATEVIARFEGHIAQYLGDGLLVYFGYPQAHEDDARRAVRAGLGIVEALGPLQARLQREQGVSFGVRVGIHSGLVVVGDMGEGPRQERLALGETPNLAARLQGLAEANTVLISGPTERLVQGWFVREAIGEQPLKGFSQPLPVYRVIEESAARSRLDVAGVSGLTPLVGREREVDLLLERWEQAKRGLGPVILLSGEAGIGKTRLLRAVEERLAGEPYTRLECRCLLYTQQSTLYPVIDLGRRLLQVQRDEPSDVTLGKLEAALAPHDVTPPEAVPLLASLLSLPLPERYPPLQYTPRRQKQKTLETILTLLRARAAQQPVLFIVEDLHWSDSSTLELLTLLIDQEPTGCILTVLTSRPEFHPSWGTRAPVTVLTLGRLLPTQAAQMIDGVARGKHLPAAVRQEVVAKTDGVPLFVEELTKMVLESGLLREQADHYGLQGPLPALAIPATLHDSLMARLDRLGEAKEVAQLGAILGRAFPYELLRAVSPWNEKRLQRGLTQLVEAELLRGIPPRDTYVFKHALIQETAYQSLLKRTRQQYHRQTVRVLERQFPEIVETQPELLAYHYTEAGLPAQAVPYWQRAGQRAVERSANVEAVSHFTKGLELVKALPKTPEHIRQELALQLALGPPLRMIKGHTAPEVEALYSRAYELSQLVGDSWQQCAALVGLGRFYINQAGLRKAHEVGEQCLTLAQHVQDPVFLLEALRMFGVTSFFLGDLLPARRHLEEGIALYDAQQGHSQAFSSGMDPGVVCLSYLSWTLWLLGYPEQALTRNNEALALAQRLCHAYSLSFALTFACGLSMCLREVQRVREQAEATIALAREHGFVRWLAVGTAWKGWALAEQGEVQEGIAQIYKAIGMRGELGVSQMLLRLAELYGKAGQAEDGLRVLAEALAAVSKSGERRFEAEFHRVRGEILLQCGFRNLGSEVFNSPLGIRNPHLAEAENCFRQAIDVARSQHAKSLELRAAMSLSRLWQTQGKRQEALSMLQAIYGWFTEGFDTLDLQEAKALLEALR